MNKMHTLAKTLISIIAVYWLILMVFSAIQMLFMYMLPAYKSALEIAGVWNKLIFLPIFNIVLIAVIVRIICKRERIADKIVGIEEIQGPDSQVEWIPFAFRLISVIAGMYCFFRVVGYLPTVFNDFLVRQAYQGKVSPGSYMIYDKLLIVVMLLIAGTYLLCGAPHFVRWQIKKTIEMCTSEGEK